MIFILPWNASPVIRAMIRKKRRNLPTRDSLPDHPIILKPAASAIGKLGITIASLFTIQALDSVKESSPVSLMKKSKPLMPRFLINHAAVAMPPAVIVMSNHHRYPELQPA